MLFFEQHVKLIFWAPYKRPPSFTWRTLSRICAFALGWLLALGRRASGLPITCLWVSSLNSCTSSNYPPFLTFISKTGPLQKRFANCFFIHIHYNLLVLHIISCTTTSLPDILFPVKTSIRVWSTINSPSLPFIKQCDELFFPLSNAHKFSFLSDAFEHFTVNLPLALRRHLLFPYILKHLQHILKSWNFPRPFWQLRNVWAAMWPIAQATTKRAWNR